MLIEISQRLEDMRNTLATRTGAQRVLERRGGSLHSF